MLKNTLLLIFILSQFYKLNAQIFKNIVAKDTGLERYSDSNCHFIFNKNQMTKYINIDSSVVYDFQKKSFEIKINIDDSYGKRYNQISLKFDKKITLTYNDVSYDFDSLVKHPNQKMLVWTSKTAYNVDQILNFSYGSIGVGIDQNEISYIYFRTFKASGRIAIQKWLSNDYSLLDYSEESNIYTAKREYLIAIHDCNDISGQSIYYYDYNNKDGLFFNKSQLIDKDYGFVIFGASFPLSVDTSIIPYSTNILFPLNPLKKIKKNAVLLSRESYLKSYYALVTTGNRYAYGTPYSSFLLDTKNSTKELYKHW